MPVPVCLDLRPGRVELRSNGAGLKISPILAFLPVFLGPAPRESETTLYPGSGCRTFIPPTSVSGHRPLASVPEAIIRLWSTSLSEGQSSSTVSPHSVPWLNTFRVA
eukprot:1686263-Rhodomonas_salina.1